MEISELVIRLLDDVLETSLFDLLDEFAIILAADHLLIEVVEWNSCGEMDLCGL